MNKKVLLIIAGILAIFTFLGHTAGTLMSIPPEQVEVAKTAAIMKSTLVPMPVGKAQSYGDLFFGNNITVSLFLLISGFGFFIAATKHGLDGSGRKWLFLNSCGMAGICIISSLYFFPIPAVLTGISAILGFIVAKKG